MLILEPSIQVNIRRLGLLLPGNDSPVLYDLNRKDLQPLSVVECPSTQEPRSFGDAVDLWRRKSGIPRPSSAARACIAAATVCRKLVDAGQWNPARLAIVTASTSSATAMAVNFETRGLTESWSAVDPLLLPSTLFSALATQIAMAVGARGFAMSCVVGLLGVFHAVEAAIHGLTRRDVDAVLVVASEEQTLVQRSAHEVLGWLPTPRETAGALALERDTRQGYRVAFVAYGDTLDVPIPPGWETASRRELRTPFPEPSMQSGAMFAIICEALLTQESRVIVTGDAAGLGSASVGFEMA